MPMGFSLSVPYINESIRPSLQAERRAVADGGGDPGLYPRAVLGREQRVEAGVSRGLVHGVQPGPAC